MSQVIFSEEQYEKLKKENQITFENKKPYFYGLEVVITKLIPKDIILANVGGINNEVS